MAYRTINVAPETYEELLTYKVAGASFDDIIRALIARTPARTVHARILLEHRRRLQRMRGGEYVPLRDLERALKR